MLPFQLRVTVPVIDEVEPPTTLADDSVTLDRVGGWMVRVAETDPAVILAVVVAATALMSLQ